MPNHIIFLSKQIKIVRFSLECSVPCDLLCMSHSKEANLLSSNLSFKHEFKAINTSNPWEKTNKFNKYDLVGSNCGSLSKSDSGSNQNINSNDRKLSYDELIIKSNKLKYNNNIK